jgi:glycosyltransferase involved in cell wall biosynthesis
MKIAVVDHFLNPGGGARIIRALLPAMKKVNQDLDITFFGTAHGIKRERLDEVAIPNGIKVKTLQSTALSGKDLFKIKGSRFVISLLQNKWSKWQNLLPFYLSGKVHKELESRVKGFDIAFFTWPFHLECPKLACPMVGIFQDFNYKYYFSSNVSTPWMTQSLNTHIPDLLAQFTPIVTSQFVADELRKFYPSYGKDVRVVPIAPMGERRNEEAVKKTLDKFQIKKKFLLYPTNTASHKNIGPLLAALPLIKKQGHDICLILAGLGTENINGKACEQGVELCNEERDVFGLGYVSNDEINALIQSATAVVNCSLYEGNNGPALDAWAQGTPVAMSEIPPFVELLSTFNVKAAIFDPRSPQNIADKIGYLLAHIEETAQDVISSKKAMEQYTWEKCALQYLNIFSELISK